jgi:protein-L-isoaspartate(D-aspartate) O-methyltransferase
MVRDQLTGSLDAAVVQAMAAIPRHAFVPDRLRTAAYDDAALAIGGGATISQPRVVACMLSALALRPGQRILDVGAGSGYAAALLARLTAPGGAVTAIERLGQLIPATRLALAAHAPQVDLVHGDALAGAAGPWDAIHIACACIAPPAELLAALAPGGRMVLPIGAPDGDQELCLVTMGPDGPHRRTLMAVSFVPALPGTVDG